jgi:hypothetical protein
MAESSIKTCPICGAEYDASDPDEALWHADPDIDHVSPDPEAEPGQQQE